jgi:1,4-dihydroxy-2-naphthoate polyprenyltransferase
MTSIPSMIPSSRPSFVATWWQACRAYSFPASIVPCLVGTAFSAAAGAKVTWVFFPLTLLAGVLLHVATNLTNDAVDFVRGVDTEEAQGGSGVLTSRLVTVKQVWLAVFLAFALAALCGLPMLLTRGWPLLAIGVVGGIGGYAYTGPPFGLKYHALGEVVVFLLMGTLMMAGSAYALSGVFPDGVWLASIPVGFLVAAILAANNQRDGGDDGRTDIHTLAILFGPKGARAVTLTTIVGAYLSIPVLVLAHVLPLAGLLPLVTLPIAIPLIKSVAAMMPDRPPMHGVVERVAALHMFFGLAYAVGLGLSAFFS